MNEILSLELKADQERLSRLIQKRAAIEKGYDFEGEAGRKFAYNQELIEVNKEIAQLKEKIYRQGGTPDSHYAWKEIFEQHQLRNALKPLVTVDCNRKEHYEQRLLKHFEDAAGTQNNLFYLIVACPYQRPASIAKRLVYEASKDLSIVFAEDAGAKEVVVNELEFGLKPEHSWKRLWDSIQDNRNLVSQAPESLDALTAQLAEKDYMALVYRHNAQTWNEKRIEHLRHIARQFQNMPENNRKFLVCIAIEFLQIHDQNCEKYALELAQLEAFCREINTNGLLSACISLLPPVESEWVKGWCADKFSKDGEKASQRILEKLKQETQAQDRFNMDQIEPMQEAAFQHSINRPRPDLPF